MFKKNSYLLLLLLSSLAKPAIKNPTALHALAFATDIQPSEWTAKTAKTILAPSIALHALEHFGAKNDVFAKKLAGDVNNPNRKTALAAFCGAKALHHIIPNILMKKNPLNGVTSFLQSGHGAEVLLALSYLAETPSEKMFLYAAAACLIAYQIKTVHSVYKELAEEAKQLGLGKIITPSFLEPSPTHVKLPRYLSQNLMELGIKTAALSGENIYLKHSAKNELHFNKEFFTRASDTFLNNSKKLNYRDTYKKIKANAKEWDLFIGKPLDERKQNKPLLRGKGFLQSKLKRHSIFMLAKSMLACLPTTAEKIYEIEHHSQGSSMIYFFMIVLDKILRPEGPAPEKYNAQDKNLFMSRIFSPWNAFIPQAAFVKLSQKLQNKINALNQQELIYKAQALVSPSSENLFSLAQYTCQTEYKPSSESDRLLPSKILLYVNNSRNDHPKDPLSVKKIRKNDQKIKVAHIKRKAKDYIKAIDKVIERTQRSRTTNAEKGKNQLKRLKEDKKKIKKETKEEVDSVIKELSKKEFTANDFYTYRDGINQNDFSRFCLPRLKVLRKETKKPINYIEHCLRCFIATYDTAEDSKYQTEARALAEEVLKEKPVSKLAQKVMELRPIKTA